MLSVVLTGGEDLVGSEIGFSIFLCVLFVFSINCDFEGESSTE